MRTRKVIFLDRDGVINKDPGGWTRHNYVTNLKELVILPGVFDALKKLKCGGIEVIVISNQAGVNKGYFSKADLERINDRILEEVSKHGGRIAEAFYCVHRDEDNCNCRKPKTGLFEMAAKKYNINIRGAYFIGDSHADMIAGRMIGTRNIFVLSGKTSREEMGKWKEKPDYVFNDLLEAVDWLLAKQRRKDNRALRRKNEK